MPYFGLNLLGSTVLDEFKNRFNSIKLVRLSLTMKAACQRPAWDDTYHHSGSVWSLPRLQFCMSHDAAEWQKHSTAIAGQECRKPVDTFLATKYNWRNWDVNYGRRIILYPKTPILGGSGTSGSFTTKKFGSPWLSLDLEPSYWPKYYAGLWQWSSYNIGNEGEDAKERLEHTAFGQELSTKTIKPLALAKRAMANVCFLRVTVALKNL
ncbi:capsid [Cyclovirus sp.]|nr:capsid [Cyclovirus sp.]